jgi:hypothetical protein
MKIQGIAIMALDETGILRPLEMSVEDENIIVAIVKSLAVAKKLTLGSPLTLSGKVRAGYEFNMDV